MPGLLSNYAVEEVDCEKEPYKAISFNTPLHTSNFKLGAKKGISYIFAYYGK